MIADSFFVAFDLGIVARLPGLVAFVGVGDLGLANSGSGAGICAPANVEFGYLSRASMGGVVYAEPSFVSVLAGTFQV